MTYIECLILHKGYFNYNPYGDSTHLLIYKSKIIQSCQTVDVIAGKIFDN